MTSYVSFRSELTNCLLLSVPPIRLVLSTVVFQVFPFDLVQNVSVKHVLLAWGRCFGVSNVSVHVSSSKFQFAISRFLRWPSSITEGYQDELMSVMFCAVIYVYGLSRGLLMSHKLTNQRCLKSFYQPKGASCFSNSERTLEVLWHVLVVRECIFTKQTKSRAKQKETEKKTATTENRGSIEQNNDVIVKMLFCLYFFIFLCFFHERF